MPAKVVLDLEKLKDLYLNKQFDAKRCAKELDTSPQTILRNLKKLKIDIRNSHCRKNKEIDKDILYDEFITNKLTLLQIAEKYKITKGRVSELLALYQISFRDRKIIPTKEELYIKYSKEKQSLNDICNLYNLEYYEIKKLISNYNIQYNRNYSSLNKEMLIDLLLIQNKSIKETANYLNCSISHVNKYIKIYNIHKTPEQVKELRENSCLNKYGIKNAGGSKESQDKIYKTKKKNHTISTSKPEEQIYLLLINKFNDVKRQYKSKEYPFACDFYIYDLNLYIEYQGDWGHGSEPFDFNNITHVEKLNKWKRGMISGHPRYKTAINTWTIRDPLKRETAKNNNLNWIEFFTMKEFMNWYMKF